MARVAVLSGKCFIGKEWTIFAWSLVLTNLVWTGLAGRSGCVVRKEWTRFARSLVLTNLVWQECALLGKNELCSFMRSLAYVEQYRLTGVFILRYLTIFLPGGQLLLVSYYGRFQKNYGPLFLPGLAWYCSTYNLTPPGQYFEKGGLPHEDFTSCFVMFW